MRMSPTSNYMVLLSLIVINAHSGSTLDLPPRDKNFHLKGLKNSKYQLPGDAVAKIENGELDYESDEIKGFAVFVDSPDTEEPLAESGEHVDDQPAALSDAHDDVEDDESILSETSMKEILSKKLQNGSVIHDIRIVVKHPQNVKGKKGRKLQKITHKKTSGMLRRGKTPSPTTSPSYKKTTGKLDSNNQTHPTIPGTINRNCSNSSCHGQIGEYSEEDPVLYSQWQWTMLTGETHYVNYTLNTTGINSELTSNMTITGDSFVGNGTGKYTKLGPNMDVQRELTTVGKCPNAIYLNLTDSDSCVSQCLISCIMSKNGPVIDKTLVRPKENVRVYDKSPSEDSTVTHLAGVEEHGTERTGYKLNSEINRNSTSKVNTKTQPNTKSTAAPKKTASINKSKSKDDSTETNFAGENVTELDGIRLIQNFTATVKKPKLQAARNPKEAKETGKMNEQETNLHVLVGSEIKHNLLDISEVKKSDVPYILKDICLTEACVLKAADVLKRMNSSADPCVNFYEFACGRFLKGDIPHELTAWSVYTEISYDILRRMSSLMREPAKTSDPSQMVELKRFYGACVKSSTRSMMLEFLEELGGWPAPHNPSWKMPKRNWQDIAFNWTHGEAIEHNFVLFGLTNKTGELLGLSLEQPGFVKEALKTNGPDVIKTIVEQTATIAFALGVDNNTVVDSIRVLHLFMSYAISYATNITQVEVGRYTLRELKQKFPHLTILKSLPSLLETSVGVKIGDEEVFHVIDVVYMQKIDTLIRDTPVKTQMALLVMTAMRALFNLITTIGDQSKNLLCIKFAWELYPDILNNIYSVNFVDDKRVNGVVKILSQVKNSLEKSLAESTLEEKIASIALDRLKTLTFIVSLQNRHDRGFGRTGLAELVDKLNSSFALMIKAGIGNYRRGVYEFLHRSYKSSFPYILEKFYGFKYRVNSFVTESYVFIPFTLMHENIYNEDLPSYTNFAGVGIVFGHELVHGVTRGGSLRNSSRFLFEEQCLVDQFSDFTERYLGLPLDGKDTKDENIADLGGFREAYLAYTNWAKNSNSKNELRLPGLHRFNNRQMFWLTAASSWCKVYTRQEMAVSLRQDEHAPAENRVNGQLANLPEFSRDFHCPLNSPMNPKEKCSIW